MDHIGQDMVTPAYISNSRLHLILLGYQLGKLTAANLRRRVLYQPSTWNQKLRAYNRSSIDLCTGFLMTRLGAT